MAPKYLRTTWPPSGGERQHPVRPQFVEFRNVATLPYATAALLSELQLILQQIRPQTQSSRPEVPLRDLATHDHTSRPDAGLDSFGK